MLWALKYRKIINFGIKFLFKFRNMLMHTCCSILFMWCVVLSKRVLVQTFKLKRVLRICLKNKKRISLYLSFSWPGPTSPSATRAEYRQPTSSLPHHWQLGPTRHPFPLQPPPSLTGGSNRWHCPCSPLPPPRSPMLQPYLRSDWGSLQV